MTYHSRRGEGDPMVGCLVIVVIFVVLSVVGWAAGWFGYFSNRAGRTVVEVTEKTMNGDNVIYNYEWFTRQYNDYSRLKNQAAQAQASVDNYIKTLPADREKWTTSDKNEVARLMAVVDGFRYQLQDCISEYNAKSKMVNRNIFKDKSLPERLE